MYPQNAALPSLRVGDELRIPGLPIHAMIYVGPLGAHGEDVLDAPKNGEARGRNVFHPPPRRRAVILFNEKVGHQHLLPADFKDWEAHMSIKATAVVKKETKVDPKKPNDKAYYASLSVLNEDGKEYGLPRHLGEFREVAVLLKREAGVTHEQLHERFAAYERGEEISFPLTLESDEAIKNLGFDPKAA